jgi:hypothetical protein
MKITRLLAWTGLLALLSQASSLAQSPFLFRITFRGTVFQTNATGSFVATRLTEASFIEDAARAGGVDPASLGLAYHIQSDGLGDTIEVVDGTTGATRKVLFGLFFGSDASLGRTAATNSPLTEIKRLDYLYTLEKTTYTSWNSHSMGSALTTKRFLSDANGNSRTTIDAEMQWIVNPQDGNGTKICKGTFTTTTPF